MDKLRSITKIMEIVRSQISNRSSSTTRNKSPVTKNKKVEPRQKRISQDELKDNIAKKLKSLDAEDTNSALPKEILLESIILWEFGEQISNDPFFSELKSKITSAINENKEASDKLDKVIEQLLDPSN